MDALERLLAMTTSGDYKPGDLGPGDTSLMSIEAMQQLSRAERLVEQDMLLLDRLRETRRARMTVEEVAERLGWSVEEAHEFEAYDANPSLATIRRYAHAIGVRITHKVEAD